MPLFAHARGLTLASRPPLVEVKSGELERAAGLASQQFGRPYVPRTAVSQDVAQLIRESFDRVIWVYRCIQVKAGQQARLPIEMWRGEGNDAEQLDDHVLFPRLNFRANAMESAGFFRRRLSQQFELSPRGVFAEMVRTNGGDITSITLLPPSATTAVPDATKGVSEYQVKVGTRTEHIDPANVLWFRNPHPDNPYRSATPLEACGVAVDMDFAAMLMNLTFMRNFGRPGMLVAVKNLGSDADADEIRSYFRGGARFGETRVVDADEIDAIDLAKTPADAQWLQLKGLTKNEICEGFGVPVSMIGNASARTFCVDTATEILTRRGWLTFDAVRVGDIALTLNTATGLAEWQPVDAVNIFDGPHDMIGLDNGRHNSLTTAGHRWFTSPMPCRRVNWKSMPVWRWQTTEQLGLSDRVPAAAAGSAPSQAKYDDDFVELVAWHYTEGWNGPCGNVVITQSERVNPEKAAQIRGMLTRLFGPPRPLGAGKGGWIERAGRQDTERGITRFHLSRPLTELLRCVAPDKVPTVEFFAELTHAQLGLFIQTSLDGDGSRNSPRSSSTGLPTPYRTPVFAQSDRRRIDAFQVACALAGRSGQVRQDRTGRWFMAVQASPWRAPGKKGNRRDQTIAGPVWCPTTANGTWFARREGTTYFTGNSNADAEITQVFWGGTMPDHLDAISDVFDLVDGDEQTHMRFNTDSVPVLAAAERADREEERLDTGAGIMTIDEARGRRGLEPVPGGDVVRVPFSLAPIGPSAAAPARGVPAGETTTAPQGTVTETPPKTAGNGGGRKASRSASDAVPFSREDLRQLADWHLAAQEKLVASEMVRYFERQRRAVLARLTGPKTRIGTRHDRTVVTLIEPKAIDVDRVFQADKWDAELRTVADGFLVKIMGEAGQAVFDVLFGGGLKAALPHFDVYDPAVKEAIARRTARIVGANQTTRDAIRDQVGQGDAAGESIDQIAARVEGVFSQAAGYRSTLIARTETGSAHSAAQLIAASDSGVVETKSWVAVGDDRTRETHTEAESQGAIGLDETFTVGDYDMLAPGDDSAGPEEICNCRCVLEFSVDESAYAQATGGGE